MPSPAPNFTDNGSSPATPVAPRLQASGMQYAYGDLVAVWDISIAARPGSATAVVGRNGAGKSTLLSGLAGLLPALKGTVTLDGEDITATPAWDRYHAGLCLVPEGKRVFRDLSVEENLRLGLGGKVPRRERGERFEEVFARFPILSDRRAQLAGSLSGGQQQQLAVATAVINRPKVLMVDEPSSGLSPIATDAVLAALGELKREGLAIILVEQLIEQVVTGIADLVVVVEQGRVVLEDVPARIELADLERRLSVA